MAILNSTWLSLAAQTYLLPIVIDDVHVVGLSRDIGHVDLLQITVEHAAEMIIRKIEERSQGILHAAVTAALIRG